MDYFELVSLIAKNHQLEIPEQVPYLIKQIILQCWHSIPEIRPPFQKVVPLLASACLPPSKNSGINTKHFKLDPKLHFNVIVLGDAGSGKVLINIYIYIFQISHLFFYPQRQLLFNLPLLKNLFLLMAREQIFGEIMNIPFYLSH